MKTKKLRLKNRDSMGLVIGVILLFVVFSIAIDGFFSWYNLHNVLKDFSILLVVASGMTIAILLGKIDMSAGSVMSLSAVVTAIFISSGAPFILALLGGIIAGALIGLLNGYLIGVQRLNHFISTFATMSLAKGIALVVCGGQIINCNSPELLFIGTGKVFGLFFIVWFAIIAFAIMYFLMRKSRYGFKVYAVGGSETAARLSGINTTKTYLISFIVIGALAAVAGIFMAGKANSGNATMGDGYEFNAIATVLIGGTPFDGGKGGLAGTAIGALFITILKNGISLFGLTPAWQYAIIGVVILVVIILDVTLNERRKIEAKRRVEQ